MGSTRDSRRPGIATGLTLLVPITLSTMAIVLLAPIVPKLMGEFHSVPNADYLVPTILTLPALCVALLSPIAGALGDFVGRRRLLIGSLLLYGCVGILPVFLKSLTAILISRVGVGIAEALIMTMSTTLIGDYFQGSVRDKWLAAQTAFASLSALLFFNVGGILGNFGWRSPFWIYAASFAMLAAVLVYTWEPGEASNATDGQDHLGNASWSNFPWRKMLCVLGVTVFGSVLFYTVQIHASNGLVAHGLSDSAKIGFFTSVASLGVPIGTYIYGRLKHGNVGRLLLLEFTILGIGFLGMGFAPSVPTFLIACFINQCGAGLLLPTLLVWAMSQLSFDIRARGIGLWQSAFAFGQFLSPIAVTTVTRSSGSLLIAFEYLGVAGFCAAAVALIVVLRRRSIQTSAAA